MQELRLFAKGFQVIPIVTDRIASNFFALKEPAMSRSKALKSRALAIVCSGHTYLNTESFS